MNVALRRGTVRDFAATYSDEVNTESNSTPYGDVQVEMQKAGAERYLMLLHPLARPNDEGINPETQPSPHATEARGADAVPHAVEGGSHESRFNHSPIELHS